MLRLIIIFILVIAAGLFISRLLPRKWDDGVIDGEVSDAESKPNTSSPLSLLFLGLLLAGVVLFVLQRFGISVMGLLQKAITFLPLLRGMLPF